MVPVVHYNKTWQSELIGQWATPHHRRLGGIGRVVPIENLIVPVVHHDKSQLITKTKLDSPSCPPIMACPPIDEI